MSRKRSGNYEALIVIQPTLVEDERNAIIEKIQKIIVDGGADLKEVAPWGQRKLAYPIQKRNEGYYVIYYFTHDTPAEMLKVFERTCRYDENVIRHMVVQVPTKKWGKEIAQLVPAPGWLSNFSLEISRSSRRRGPRPAPPYEAARSAEAEGKEQAPKEEPPKEEIPREQASKEEAPKEEASQAESAPAPTSGGGEENAESKE